jgi:hypothetical protein
MEHDSRAYPTQEELDVLEARGCDFGTAPWIYYGPGSPHYGPPQSCKNHSYPNCPSHNPYYRIMDEYIARGEDLPPPVTRAPAIRLAKPMKKKKAAKAKKPRPAKIRAMRRDRDAFDMQALSEALAAEAPAPGPTRGSDISDELASLIGKMRVGNQGTRPRLTRRRKSKSGRKKKKGGRRTRK